MHISIWKELQMLGGFLGGRMKGPQEINNPESWVHSFMGDSEVLNATQSEPSGT